MASTKILWSFFFPQRKYLLLKDRSKSDPLWLKLSVTIKKRLENFKIIINN